ncbi:MAG: cell division ATP-binding protein FtsE [Steroidobacteraceae bacterium]
MIRFSHVTKEYPRTGLALNNASFHIAKGEFAFLTGPSGAGKSTILKLVYMEERPSSGEVRVGGMRSSDLKRREVPKLRRRLGIVFQDFRLLDDRTAEQNIAFALEVTGTPRDAIPAKVGRLLTQVGLASKGTSLPRELSGGEQQRVAIARAFVTRPAVLFADEPTGNLDTSTGERTMDLLFELNRASGTTLILVTHDASIAGRCRRRIHLEAGHVVP